MGRRKIEIVKIDNARVRATTFIKRRAGMLKKANELAVLCGARVCVLVTDEGGQASFFSSANLSLQDEFNSAPKTYTTISADAFMGDSDDERQPAVRQSPEQPDEFLKAPMLPRPGYPPQQLLQNTQLLQNSKQIQLQQEQYIQQIKMQQYQQYQMQMQYQQQQQQQMQEAEQKLPLVQNYQQNPDHCAMFDVPTPKFQNDSKEFQEELKSIQQSVARKPEKELEPPETQSIDQLLQPTEPKSSEHASQSSRPKFQSLSIDINPQEFEIGMQSPQYIIVQTPHGPARVRTPMAGQNPGNAFQ